MKKVYVALTLLVLGLGGVLSYKLYQRSKAADAPVGGSGTVEGVELDIVPKVAGRILEVSVEEGASVRAGQVLATLDCADLRTVRDEGAARVAVAEANVATAKAAVLAATAGERASLAVARASRDSARMARLAERAARAQAQAASEQANVARSSERSAAAGETAATAQVGATAAERWIAQRTRERVVRLAERDVTPVADLDLAKGRDESLSHQVDAAKANAEAAHDRRLAAGATTRAAGAQASAAAAQVDTARAQGDAAKASAAGASAQAEGVAAQRGGSQAQQSAAEHTLAAAKAALARADVQLGECVLRAPRDAVVLGRNHEPGEMALPGTRVLTLMDLRDARTLFYLPNADLGHAAPGGKVEVLVDAYPGKVFEGRILSISTKAEFTPRNIQTREDRDRLVYAVKVAIANPELQLRAGMPVEVRIPGTQRARP